MHSLHVEYMSAHSSSAQSLSRVQHFVTPWTEASQASLSITNSQSLLKLMSIESGMPSNQLILCCTLLLQLSVFLSIRVFSNDSVLHIRWPKNWSISFSISPSNEYSGLISFRMDWLDLHAVQGTLKSLLQHHSSKALILLRSAFCLDVCPIGCNYIEFELGRALGLPWSSNGLRVHLPGQGTWVWVQSRVEELRSHMLRGQ